MKQAIAFLFGILYASAWWSFTVLPAGTSDLVGVQVVRFLLLFFGTGGIALMTGLYVTEHWDD